MYKPKKKKSAASISYAPKIECYIEIINDYGSGGGMGIILEFKGLSFSDGVFAKSREKNTFVCYTPVRYNNKDVFLIMSSLEDILELEVVPQKSGVERLFGNELYIPELANCNLSSMEAVKRNGLILVSYKPNHG